MRQYLTFGARSNRSMTNLSPTPPAGPELRDREYGKLHRTIWEVFRTVSDIRPRTASTVRAYAAFLDELNAAYSRLYDVRKPN